MIGRLGQLSEIEGRDKKISNTCRKVYSCPVGEKLYNVTKHLPYFMLQIFPETSHYNRPHGMVLM